MCGSHWTSEIANPFPLFLVLGTKCLPTRKYVQQGFLCTFHTVRTTPPQDTKSIHHSQIFAPRHKCLQVFSQRFAEELFAIDLVGRVLQVHGQKASSFVVAVTLNHLLMAWTIASQRLRSRTPTVTGGGIESCLWTLWPAVPSL